MLTLLRRLRSDESGNALVIAVTMVTLMLVLGSSALSTVDTQTDVTKRERQHESSFNLAEGVLNAQAFVMGRLGTGGVSTGQFPEECTHESTHELCPNPQQVALSYTAATQNDYDPSTAWKTRVRDNPLDPNNPSITYYDPPAVAAAARYDANGDRQLWVSAEATVRGRTRTLVALIRVEDRPITFPRYALLSHGFETSNNGNKVIIDATDPASLGVSVRCEEPNGPSPSSECLGYDPAKGQLDPPGHYETGAPARPAVTPDDLQALEEYSRGIGTYYQSCPANPNGAVVFIESGNCLYNNQSPAAAGASKCCNSAAKPGLLVVKCGSVEFSGNIEFHGIVYVPNKAAPQDASSPWCSSGIVVTAQGTALISGGVIIDGPGRMLAGSSAMNILFNPKAFENISAASTAGIVQNTWREVPDDH